MERLLERGEDVVAVCCAPTKEGKSEDPLVELARERSLPVHQPASWKTPEALALMKSFNADVCMMAYVLLFVPQEVRDAPTYGTFQYIRHFAQNIGGRLRSTGLLRWVKRALAYLFSGLMMVWMKVR